VFTNFTGTKTPPGEINSVQQKYFSNKNIFPNLMQVKKQVIKYVILKRFNSLIPSFSKFLDAIYYLILNYDKS
jgi:hypothetical protein